VLKYWLPLLILPHQGMEILLRIYQYQKIPKSSCTKDLRVENVAEQLEEVAFDGKKVKVLFPTFDET
jgi:hypothetical protein